MHPDVRDARFEAFGTSHWLMLALFVIGIPVLVRRGRRVRGTAAEDRSRKVFAAALVQPFPHPRFIAFWVMHLLVVWAAVYLTAGLGVRPTWRLYRSTVGLTVIWAVSVMTFNAVFGSSYGYLNGKPGTASVLDLLGPWPWYVVTEVVVVAVVWALITLPWTTRRRAVQAEQSLALG